MARPRKIKTAEELGALIDEFIMQCEDGKQYMDDYALMKYLGIAPRTLTRWRANEGGEYDGYGEQLEKLVAYREAVYARMVAENPKGSGGIIFLLKQPKNGGYIDKPVIDVHAQELTIKTDGIGGDSAFK